MINTRRKFFLMFILAILIAGLVSPMVLADELTGNLPEPLDFENTANRVILMTKIVGAVFWALWLVYASWATLKYLAASTNPNARTDGKEILKKVFISGGVLGSLTIIAGVAIGAANFIKG